MSARNDVAFSNASRNGENAAPLGSQLDRSDSPCRLAARGRRAPAAATAAAALLWLAGAPSAAHAQASLKGLGFLPGASNSAAAGMNSAATVVVGSSCNASLCSAFRYQSGSMGKLLDISTNAVNSYARAVNANATTSASVIVGQSGQPPGTTSTFGSAVKWTNGTIVALPALTNSEAESSAQAVNADGSVIVGATSQAFLSVGTRAVRWVNGTISQLPALPGNGQAWASGVNSDGSVIVGHSCISDLDTCNAQGIEGTAVRWVNGSVSSLGVSGSAALAVNGDGSVIVGLFGVQAFRWVNGTMSGLGFLSGMNSSAAQAVSTDGSTVVGQSCNGSACKAFRWTQATGMQSLETLLTTTGVNLNGWQLNYAVAVSPDGNTIAGVGTDPNGLSQAFLVVISKEATHDFNGDNRSDIAWRDSSGTTAVWLMNGAQILNAGGFGVVAPSWQIVGQRDFNGDGKGDWLWRDSSTGTVAMWLLNGLSVLQAGVLGNPVGWNISGTSDFNGDGNGDILWQDSAGNLAIWLMNGLSILQAGVLGNVPTNWKIAATDGVGHILWRDSQSNTVAIWAVSGFKGVQAVNLGVVASTWQIKGIGDFNGDGIPDILWQDSSGNVAIWLLNSSLHLAQAGGIGAVASSWVIQETGDFNGDGNADILWRNTTGAASIWFMNGVQLSSGSVVASVPTSWTIQVLNAD